MGARGTQVSTTAKRRDAIETSTRGGATIDAVATTAAAHTASGTTSAQQLEVGRLATTASKHQRRPRHVFFVVGLAVRACADAAAAPRPCQCRNGCARRPGGG